MGIGTYHNIFRLGKIIQDKDFWILNDIYKLIRATTNPYPGAFTFFRNRKLKIWKALLTTKISSKAGQIIEINNIGVSIGTGDNIIIIQNISLDNEVQINAQEFFSDNDIGYILKI